MTDASISEQKQIVHDCFNENIPRDCDNCPAHHSAGGICCFSDSTKFDDEDPECNDCVFHDDCVDKIFDQAGWKQSDRDEWYRRRYGRAPEPRPRHVSSLTILQRRRAALRDESDEVPRNKIIKREMRDRLIRSADTEELAPEETLLQRFTKDFAWGAMQGAFEMGVLFFRSHRLP